VHARVTIGIAGGDDADASVAFDAMRAAPYPTRSPGLGVWMAMIRLCRLITGRNPNACAVPGFRIERRRSVEHYSRADYVTADVVVAKHPGGIGD